MEEKPMYIHEALRWASLFLEEHQRETRIAEILLQYHLGFSRIQLLSSLREQIAGKRLGRFKRDIESHAKTGIPVQHLTGREEFYGREFDVNKDVLIPRPETEELLAGVLRYMKTCPHPITLVDVGTGSGVIAITLKLESLDTSVSATDISEEALAVASGNAKKMAADVAFSQGNFLEPIINQQKTVDIIVSNPPYIPFVDKSALSDTVRNFDPELALFAENNGLAAYVEIVKQAKEVMNTPGLIAFEIGYQQGEQVRKIIQEVFPRSIVDIRKDINGKDRMVFAEING